MYLLENQGINKDINPRASSIGKEAKRLYNIYTDNVDSIKKDYELFEESVYIDLLEMQGQDVDLLTEGFLDKIIFNINDKIKKMDEKYESKVNKIKNPKYRALAKEAARLKEIYGFENFTLKEGYVKIYKEYKYYQDDELPALYQKLKHRIINEEYTFLDKLIKSDLRDYILSELVNKNVTYKGFKKFYEKEYYIRGKEKEIDYSRFKSGIDYMKQMDDPENLDTIKHYNNMLEEIKDEYFYPELEQLENDVKDMSHSKDIRAISQKRVYYYKHLINAVIDVYNLLTDLLFEGLNIDIANDTLIFKTYINNIKKSKNIEESYLYESILYEMECDDEGVYY